MLSVAMSHLENKTPLLANLLGVQRQTYLYSLLRKPRNSDKQNTLLIISEVIYYFF